MPRENNLRVCALAGEKEKLKEKETENRKEGEKGKNERREKGDR